MRQGMAGGMGFRGQTERDRVGFDGGTPLSVAANFRSQGGAFFGKRALKIGWHRDFLLNRPGYGKIPGCFLFSIQNEEETNKWNIRSVKEDDGVSLARMNEKYIIVYKNGKKRRI